MKKTALFASVVLLLSMAACKTQKKTETVKKMQDTITTASGLKYFITQKGTGVQAQKGNRVSVHYTGKLTNDTVFDSSYRRNQPFTFKLGAGQVIKGWDEGIALLHVGDKATFIIPSQLGYGARATGSIPANSTLIFDVELMDAVDASPKPFDVAGKDTVTTASGLKYIKVKTLDTGIKPVNGKQVTVHYTGYLTDGSVFDSSVERGQPLPFTLGVGQVIKGWDEGIALLKTGEKARLIIPYTLGYGERGYPPVIPEKATLIFDVELVSAAQ